MPRTTLSPVEIRIREGDGEPIKGKKCKFVAPDRPVQLASWPALAKSIRCLLDGMPADKWREMIEVYSD